jgi:hypothetical protein
MQNSLLKNNINKRRAGAKIIIDKESRTKQITASRLKEFYVLYMRRHHRINNWGLVDLGCLHLTGGYPFDKPREVIYQMDKSKNS